MSLCTSPRAFMSPSATEVGVGSSNGFMPLSDHPVSLVDHHKLVSSPRSLVYPVLEHALRYGRLGLAVLPLHRPVRRGVEFVCSCDRCDCRSPAKHPFGKLARNGVRDASKDPSVIAGWFHNRPLNLGIATGAISGIFVLDIDPRHDGDTTLADLERVNGALPPTWRFLTGGGGEHILFRHPGSRISNSKVVGAGIDLRGDGGYIVAPPSQHILGRPYAISVDHHPDEMGLSEAPPWLLRLIHSRVHRQPEARSTQCWRTMASSLVDEGERNQTVARLAGHLLRKRVDPYIALTLLQSWNRSQCRPPLHEAEVLATVESIARREIQRRERGNHG